MASFEIVYSILVDVDDVPIPDTLPGDTSDWPRDLRDAIAREGRATLRETPNIMPDAITPWDH